MSNIENNSEQTYKANPLGYAPIGGLLKKFAIPSIVAMVVSALYNIVDQIFIGQGVGYMGNAATNVSFPLLTVCLAIALCIGVGSATRFSLYLGMKNRREAERTVGNGLLMMIIFGVIYAVIVEIFLPTLLKAFGSTDEIMPYALSYARIITIGLPFQIINIGLSNIARSDGSPKFSMNCMVVGAIINTVLDPIFIFAFHMGVAGAAIATVISQIISCMVALTYLKKFKQIKFSLSDMKLSGGLSLHIATLGMSNGLNQVAMTFVQIVLNNSLTYYGASSIYGAEIPLAAAGIVMKTNAILFSVLIGLSQGCLPIFGFNYGAKNYDRVMATLKLAIKWDLIVSAIAYVIFQGFPSYVLALFGKGNNLYMEFAVMFMHIFCITLIINGVQLISANFFSAIGKPLKGLLLSMTRQVLFLIPLLLLLPRIWGIHGVMYSAPVADIISFIVTILMVIRELNHMKALKAQVASPVSENTLEDGSTMQTV